MKWILALVIIVGLLWLGGNRISSFITAGRKTAGVLTQPVYDLSNTLDQTRARVRETNRKIDALAGQAAAVGTVGSTQAYGAQARRDLQNLNR